MIDVKTIAKPKNSGKAPAINSGGMAYAGMAVKEAAHAAKADIATMAKDAEHARQADDSKEATHAKIADLATRAQDADHAVEADHAKEADNADTWDYRQFDDYLDQGVRTGDTVTFEQVVTDTVRNAGQFVDGLLGSGFRLWRDEDGVAQLTVDKLTVRQTMLVLELLIEKVRSVGGQLCVSAANGKVKAVEDMGDHYRLTFEQDNLFAIGDLMRCATWDNGTMKGYWVEVVSSDEEGVTIAKSDFGSAVPTVGDDCVLMGNTRDKSRQNLILISATEDGQPRIDVMDGVSEKDFSNCLRARLGSLDGISDAAFPGDRQPKGYGIYSDNAFFKGTFILSTGEDIKTKFEITETKINSAVEGLRQDFLDDKGYLSNATFYEGMAKWDTSNEAVFFLAGNRWIWANRNVLSKKGRCAGVTKDRGKNVVMIRNKYICQKNANLRDKPKFNANGDGLKEPVPVYLSFYYRCSKVGTLEVSFEQTDVEGFVAFEPLAVQDEITETDGYRQYTCSGLWNGTGDFKLSFTGEIYLYMLVLSTDKVEVLTYKYKTLFEQSERLIKMSAAVYDKDERALQETGLMLKPEGAGIYMQTSDGKMALIGVAMQKDGKTVVKLTGDNILLEGNVTANGNFKILEDGSIVAKNGSFEGTVNATAGSVGGFKLSDGHIGADMSPDDEVFGYLSIYKDFLRVGGKKGYVMLGNDVIPGSAGGAFTAVGRIVNEAPNVNGQYGLDQANYGLFLNVSGGTKNYGIHSNAALMAPAFVNTKAKLLTFVTGQNYSVDFSQCNIILMYYKDSRYSGTEVTLPGEATVARQFGLSSLPNDFATIVIFRVRAGSQKITLKGIYDSDEDLSDYEMAPGDSVQVLISKADGFRYQILNNFK